MVKVIIKIDANKLPKISQKLPAIRKKGLQYTSQGLVRQLMLNSPVDTGLLRQWFFRNYGEYETHIRSPAKYVTFVNDGTGIYGPRGAPIVHPVIGKKFAFQVGGKMVFTNMIKGQKGQHFVEKSISETEDKIGQFFIKSVREVLN